MAATEDRVCGIPHTRLKTMAPFGGLLLVAELRWDSITAMSQRDLKAAPCAPVCEKAGSPAEVAAAIRERFKAS